jgi:hypothetical protein
LALGSTIVRELKLDRRGDTLQRWMAHHLAELITKAEGATGADKVEHERAATDLILKLWLHRRGLPQEADPLAGFTEAIKLLKHLSTEANPWMRFHHPNRPYAEELRKMFNAMSSAVVGGIALTQLTFPPEIDETQAEFLEPAERELLSAMAQWQSTALAVPKVRIIRFEATPTGEATPTVEANDDDIDEDLYKAVLGDDTTSAAEEDDKVGLQSSIAKHLAEVHSLLGRLLEAWNAAQDRAKADAKGSDDPDDEQA